MAENYKHLYEQCKKMLTMYQDELIPGFRKKIEELEQNQVKVRCKDCQHYEAEYVGIPGGDPQMRYECGYCYHWKYEPGDSPNSVDADDFCSYGERRTDE